MILARELGFEEMAFFNGRTSLPDLPPLSKSDISKWLLSCRDSDKNADATIYKLLGVRNTVGSLLPFEKRLSLLPSNRALMEPADASHEPKQKASARHTSERKQQRHQVLTVAAKACSKHAPRAIRQRTRTTTKPGSQSVSPKSARKLCVDKLPCLWRIGKDTEERWWTKWQWCPILGSRNSSGTGIWCEVVCCRVRPWCRQNTYICAWIKRLPICDTNISRVLKTSNGGWSWAQMEALTYSVKETHLSYHHESQWHCGHHRYSFTPTLSVL